MLKSFCTEIQTVLFYFIFCFNLIFVFGPSDGINGNMSLDRRDEIVKSPNRYDLTICSDKSSSLSRSEAGTYDVHQAEARIKIAENGVNYHNNNNVSPSSPAVNGNGTFSPEDIKKRVCTIVLVNETLLNNFFHNFRSGLQRSLISSPRNFK